MKERSLAFGWPWKIALPSNSSTNCL